MSLFVVGILKIVLLEALAALLIAAALFDRTPQTTRAFNRCFVALALLAWLGYFNFRFFRLGGGMVNVWEHYHFQLGSKYSTAFGAAVLDRSGKCRFVLLQSPDP